MKMSYFIGILIWGVDKSVTGIMKIIHFLETIHLPSSVIDWLSLFSESIAAAILDK